MTSRLRPLTKSLCILLATLLIGALLGATLTGAALRKRVESVTAMSSQGGFVAEIVEVIEPSSRQQLAAITPILDRAGKDIETLLGETRAKINVTMEHMTLELAPHLSQEQKQKLRERRNRMRERYDRFRDQEDLQPAE
jgi:hypothetical protein